MHPILTSLRRFAAYIAVWIPLGCILGVAVNITGQWPLAGTAIWTVPVTLLLAMACLAPFYVCKSAPLRSSGWGKLAFNHLVPAFGLAGLLTLLGRGIATQLTPWFADLDRGLGPAVPVVEALFVMIYLLSVALHYAALEMESSQVAEVLAREAQLKALKSQVNPHFLFNSLNSISALTAIDASRAREMCIRLADFLRTSLRLGERINIPFAEEMELARMYLDVEKVRFGGKLRVHESIEEACNAVEVPPLLIQPLVENAVKHGVAMMTEGGEIRMDASIKGDRMVFRIGNPFDAESPSMKRNGIGLRNIRARLESRFGHAASMDVEAREDWYEVTLTVPVGVKR